jgi:hypothetical protein
MLQGFSLQKQNLVVDESKVVASQPVRKRLLHPIKALKVEKNDMPWVQCCRILRQVYFQFVCMTELV